MNKRQESCGPQRRDLPCADRTCCLFAGSRAGAQFGPPASSQGSSQAAQLPLSGRTGAKRRRRRDANSRARHHTSVDTLNPTVQVQGPYTGSANSTPAMPFSGKLGLREAIQRGLHYNLGAVGQTQAARQAKAQGHAARSALLPNSERDAHRKRTRPKTWRRSDCTLTFPASHLPTRGGTFRLHGRCAPA